MTNIAQTFFVVQHLVVNAAGEFSNTPSYYGGGPVDNPTLVDNPTAACRFDSAIDAMIRNTDLSQNEVHNQCWWKLAKVSIGADGQVSVMSEEEWINDLLKPHPPVTA